MSEPTDLIPFQQALLGIILAEQKRVAEAKIDPLEAINAVQVILTYYAVQCCMKKMPTKKLAREAMKREVNRAFESLEAQEANNGNN